MGRLKVIGVIALALGLLTGCAESNEEATKVEEEFDAEQYVEDMYRLDEIDRELEAFEEYEWLMTNRPKPEDYITFDDKIEYYKQFEGKMITLVHILDLMQEYTMVDFNIVEIEDTTTTFLTFQSDVPSDDGTYKTVEFVMTRYNDEPYEKLVSLIIK